MCLLSQLLCKKSHLSFQIKCSMCPPCWWDDASKPATPLTNGVINQTLRQFAPLSDDRLLQLVDCRESLTLIGHLLKSIPNSKIGQI